MHKRELVLAIAGRSGTGKSELGKALAESRGLSVYEGSSLIKVHAQEQGITLKQRSDIEAHHRLMKQKLGTACLTGTMLRSPEKRLLYTGLRTIPNYQNIREAGGLVIGLVCPPEICFERTDKADPKNAKTLEAYLEDCRTVENSTDENGSQVDWIVEHADYVIDTSQPFPHVLTQVEAIVDAYITQ